jgi:hypothetical protein
MIDENDSYGNTLDADALDGNALDAKALDSNASRWNSAAWNDFPLAGEPEQTPVESVNVRGVSGDTVALRPGDRVRLLPQKSADIMDIALKGKVAVIEAIERDFEDRFHLAVVLEDDPGRDLGMLRQPGHRFFFSPEEVEPMALNSEVKNEP